MIADARAVWAASCDVTAHTPRPVTKEGLAPPQVANPSASYVSLDYVVRCILSHALFREHNPNHVFFHMTH